MTFSSLCLCEQHDHPSLTQFLKDIKSHSSLFHFPDIRSVTKSFFLLQVLYSVVLVPPVQRCKSGICRRVPVPRGPLSAPQPCPLGHPERGTELPVLCGRYPLCFTRGGACMSVPLSQFIGPPPSPPSDLHARCLHLHLYSCPGNKFICTIF